MLPTFEQLTNKSMNLWEQLDLSMSVFVFGLLIMMTLLSGGYPAYIIAQFNTIRSLKGQERVGGKHNFVTKILLVIQFSLAIIFMLLVGVMMQQVDFLYQSDKGYDDSGIITVSVYRVNGEQTMNQLKNQLAISAYVKGVTGQMGGNNWTELSYNGELYDVRNDRIDYDYLPTMEIDLLVGRNFNPDLESDKTNSIIVNEAFLDKVGLDIDDAIGTKIPFNRFRDLLNPEIIGVIKNYNFQSLRQAVKPQIMYVNEGKPIGELIIKIDETHMNKGVDEVRKAWLSIFPNRPFNFNYLELRNRQMYNAQESQKQVVLYAGIISILISCLGLFALSSLHIQQRSKEIGIRKVLGANMWKLLLELSKDFSLIILVAICISTPLGWYISEQWLSQFIYHTEIQISLFFLTSLLVISLAYISISYQTIITANINPVDSLKDE
jgi:putative ABC transport system permease protein